jgi:phosphate transport system protein
MDVSLEELTTLLSKMGEITEQVIQLSIAGYLEGIDVSDDVFSFSEVLVKMSIDVEEKVFELLSKYQPVASDLRSIKSYLKIGYDFERYGRYAWDISFTQKRLAKYEKSLHSPELMISLTENVLNMVKMSIQALNNHDAELAKQLAELEEKVDKAYYAYLDIITSRISIDKDLITDLLVAKYLERIADHAAYMGESIVYLVTGEKITLR